MTIKEKAKIRSHYWVRDYQDLLDEFGVDKECGLSQEQVEQNREKFGENILKEKKPTSLWEIFLEQVKSIIVGLLFVAVLLSFVFQQWVEGIAIIIVLVFNTAIGFFTELKAKRSMEALRKLGQKTTKVFREGELDEIVANELVPGDIVVFEAGDIVTADIRVFEASKLSVDESALTGESVPVSKTIETIDQDKELAERSNMLFKGTSVTNGFGRGLVTSIGMKTELGHISSLTEEAEEERTPLEKRLDELGAKLVWLTLIIAIIIIILGIISGKDLILMIKTGIALAVAAIPEGLPIVATMALAKGMWSMAQKNALINKLSSVETLGAVTVICTDKTGTLTENKMTARVYEMSQQKVELVPDKDLENNSELFKKIIELGALCNNASLNANGGKNIGDPMEIALLEAAQQKNIIRKELLKEYPEIKEDAFDPDIKMMATYHQQEGKVLVAVKGAPEAVLEASTKILTSDGVFELSKQGKKTWNERTDELASGGLRMLAFAYKESQDKYVQSYEDLIFVGLVGLLDPPRKDVEDAITRSKLAGINIIMVTGDQQGTASNIAKEVGLVRGQKIRAFSGRELKEKEDLDHKVEVVFYRVNPKQKLDLIEILQRKNEIVAMTGDGINDAPALKKADIGIAMGIRGTQVAKDVSDMILRDDKFSTIVDAIKQGRIIFTNIRRFVIYLLSCNISEIFVVALASVVNTPLPILPLQILYLNLITDVFPALALGFGEGDDSYLTRTPRDPKEPIIKNSHWFYICLYGGFITTSTLLAFFLGLNYFKLSNPQAVTMAFLTLGFAQLFHVFNMKHSRSSHFFINDITKNPYIWGAVVICSILLISPVLIPGMSSVMNLENISAFHWSIILVLSLMPLIIGQFLTHFKILTIDTENSNYLK